MGADSLPPPTIMPSSNYAVIPVVLDIVLTLQPKSILDIGVGYGKYGVLFREYLDIWKTDKPFGTRTFKLVGVEAFAGYMNPCWDVYNDVYVDNIQNLPEIYTQPFDLVFMGDVIEHLPKEQALALIKGLNYEDLLIVTPLEVREQGAVYGNPYEQHISKWDKSDLPDAQHFIVGNQQIFYLSKRTNEETQ